MTPNVGRLHPNARWFETSLARSSARCAILVLSVLILLWLPKTTQAQFTYLLTINGVMITGYTGTAAVVTVPSTINGHTVTALGDGAFFGKYQVVSISVPDTVTAVGRYVFSGCSGLTNLDLGSNVNTIGRTAFSTTSLVSFTIPNSVTNLGEGAFLGCNALTSIALGTGLTTVPTNTFLYCVNLTNVILPESVKSICDSAFDDCTNLTSVSLPSGLISLGSAAFHDCHGLRSIKLPDSLRSIGDGAFLGCDSLITANIPSNVTSFGSSAFANCSKLTAVQLADGLSQIGDLTFDFCVRLTSVTFPASMKSLGFAAFAGCTALKGCYFEGDAPSVSPECFQFDNDAIMYYLPGTKGWASTFGGRPTELWLPQLLSNPDLSLGTNGFGFAITWAKGWTVVVEATEDLRLPIWIPLATNTLPNGLALFTDPSWTRYPIRYYRARLP